MDYIPALRKLVDRGRDRRKATERTQWSITSRVTSRRGCAGSPASATGMGLLGLWNDRRRDGIFGAGTVGSDREQVGATPAPRLLAGKARTDIGPIGRHVVQQKIAHASPQVTRHFACGTPGSSGGKQIEVAPKPLDRWQAKSQAAPDTPSAIRSERPSTSSSC